jgi:acyl carrier protein
LDSKAPALLFSPPIKPAPLSWQTSIDPAEFQPNMQSKDQIYQQLIGVMEELFEIDAADITPDANLNDDLDIDSIDAVDMAVKLNDLTGKKIKPDEFKHIRTVQDVVDVVHKLVHAEN